VHERQTADRADAHPGADDLGDRGRQQQLGAGLLEVPRGGAAPARRARAREDGDGVDLVAGNDVSHLVQAAENREPVKRVGLRAELVGRQAAADDPVAVEGLAVELFVQCGDGVAVTHQQGGLQVLTPLTRPVQKAALRVPPPQGQ
jgi:hypothetical protein